MKTLTGTSFLCIFVLAAVIGMFLCLPFSFYYFLELIHTHGFFHICSMALAF